MATAKLDMEKLVSLCRRRGFIFQSSEIYGGINGFWDYGPLGVELKKNIKDAWWHDMVRNPPPGPDGQEISMVGRRLLDHHEPEGVGGERARRRVQRPDGGLQGMQDAIPGRSSLIGIDVIATRTRSRSSSHAHDLDAAASALNDRSASKRNAEEAREACTKSKSAIELTRLTCRRHPTDMIAQHDATDCKCPCPPSATSGHLTEPRAFNLMFKTHVGAMQIDENIAYLRPETAQGIFVNFKNVLDSTRRQAAVRHRPDRQGFRNEITPRNFTFRSREFEQMEIEFFCHPDESMKWYEYWRDRAHEVVHHARHQVGQPAAARAGQGGAGPLLHRHAPTSSTCSRSPTSRRSWKASPIAATST